MALQVNPVAADAQRAVDLEPVGAPGVGRQIVSGLVVDVRREVGGLAGWQVVRLKVVDPDADRMQEVPSTVLPARNESNAAGDAEQNPGPPSAMTITLPS